MELQHMYVHGGHFSGNYIVEYTVFPVAFYGVFRHVGVMKQDSRMQVTLLCVMTQ